MGISIRFELACSAETRCQQANHGAAFSDPCWRLMLDSRDTILTSIFSVEQLNMRGGLIVNEPRIYFDIVHIIETLRPGDCRTGQQLFEDLDPIISRATRQVTPRFSPVRSRAEFLELLGSIAEDARLHSHSPILHIEAHGSSSGIQTSSGECLTWTEFKAELTTINEISGLNLLVILAACDGANMVSIIQPVDRAPVRALIGPKRSVSAGEIERASLAFYRTLFDAGDVRTAWRAMNDAVAPDRLTFAVFTAEHMFRYVMHHYLKLRSALSFNSAYWFCIFGYSVSVEVAVATFSPSLRWILGTNPSLNRPDCPDCNALATNNNEF